MSEYLVDKRDIEFCLFEQGGLAEFTEMERYSEMSAEMFQMVLDEAVKFAVNEMAPLNEIGDRKGCKLVDGQVVMPDEFKALYPKFCAGGWNAVSHTPELGGMGLPVSLTIAITEIMIGACGSFMFWPGLTAGAGHLMEVYATPELRDLVVPKLYTGEWAGTMCLTEPQAGTSVGDLLTTAEEIPGSPGEYKITGNKTFISVGDHDMTPNIVHMVLARVPGDPAGTKGISLFAVPKHRFDATGKITGSNDVATVAIEEKMGIHASPTCSLAFGENGECHGYLVGERCQGIVYMFQMMNEARIATAIQGAAFANSSYQAALAYAKERVQGTKVTDRSPDAPKVTIIEHPDVRRNLMLARSMAEGTRALILETAKFADTVKSHPDEKVREEAGDIFELLTPVCKAYCTDIGFKVTEIAMQIHGGYGYIREYGVEQMMRDVKIASIYEGTNGIQALDLLGRKMRLKGGMCFMSYLQRVNEFVEANKEHTTVGTEVGILESAKNTLAMTAMGFQAQGKEDPELAILGATPFLEMFGHVATARGLLEQAVLAQEKLDGIIADQGVEGDEAIDELVRNNPDAQFYAGKVRTARFFAHNMLPQVEALGKSIASNNRDALDIVF